MGRGFIRVFVHDHGPVQVSAISSVYTLRQNILESHFPGRTIEDGLTLHFRGERLVNDSEAVNKYGIRENSTVFASVPLVGGSSGGWVWKLFYFIFVLPCFILAMILGLMPIYANGISYVFSKFANFFSKLVIEALAEGGQAAFEKTLWYNVGRIIWRVFLTVLHFGATFFYVYAASAYVVFPIFYWFKSSDICDSGIVAKDVGFWTFFMFAIIYILLNVVDWGIYITQVVTEEPEVPQIIVATTAPGLRSVKTIWDGVKFIPYYAATFGVGAEFHEVIDIGIEAIYTALDTVSQFSCDDPAVLEELCQLFTEFYKVATAGTQAAKGKKPDLASLAKHHKGGKPHAKAHGHSHGKSGKAGKAEMPAGLPAGSSGLATTLMAGAMKGEIKNYKLGPALELLMVGFCDRAAKAKNQKPPHDYAGKFETGSFDRWSANFFTNIACEFLQGSGDVQDLMYGIGTMDQVSNMMKTGGVAGLFALVLFLIMTVYNLF